jgi:hypothetical protein
MSEKWSSFLDLSWSSNVGCNLVSGRSSVVESLLPKQVVVGSNPIARSKSFNPFRSGLSHPSFILYGFGHGSI